MGVYGSPTPQYGQVTLSTLAQSIIPVSTPNPYGYGRRFLYACSSLPWAVCGSSTASSTQAALVPANVPLQLDAAMTTGGIYGIAPVGTTPIVSFMAF